uniref:4Fe-4S dicluster domain-containing protein n=1 Tax=candidate division WOR-3 bacterium TaxID=2052148 RepID=A0A7C6EG27_UNCW3
MLEERNQSNEIINLIEELSGQKIFNCFQCGACTAGCPVAFAMDPVPSQAIRMLQLGMVQEVLDSSGIWLCAACNVCGTRCPRGVDYAKISDALRALVLRSKKNRVEPDKISKALIYDAPQQAFIAGFRKFVG